MVFSKIPFKKTPERKNLAVLIIRIHILILSLLGVLWVRAQFQKKQNILSSAFKEESGKRKAKVLFNEESSSPLPDQSDSLE